MPTASEQHAEMKLSFAGARAKEAAQETAPSNSRVVRDQLYPVSIVKTARLSRKDQGKAYGSMGVYVTKGSEAARLLQEQYFHVAEEFAYTGVYEHRVGPTQLLQLSRDRT
jgi:hypothetical protein